MILNIGAEEIEPAVQTQISLIRVYNVCYWTDSWAVSHKNMA